MLPFTVRWKDQVQTGNFRSIKDFVVMDISSLDQLERISLVDSSLTSKNRDTFQRKGPSLLVEPATSIDDSSAIKAENVGTCLAYLPNLPCFQRSP